MNYTTTALLASIRRRASLPSAPSAGTADADLLALANEELQLRLVADIMSVREEYFVRTQDVAIESGRTEYRIPSRAVGGVLRDVALVNGDGRTQKLPRISPERIGEFSGNTGTWGYYLQGNNVVLLPMADSSWPTLRLYFFARPSELTATASDYATITDSDPDTGIVTVASTVGLTSNVDLVAGTPGFEHLAMNINPIASTATTLTLAYMPPNLAIGDYVCRADLSPVPQIPAEWHPILAQRVAVKVLEAIGDGGGMQAAQMALLEMEDKARKLVTPRVQGSPEKIINRSSPLRAGAARFRRFVG